MNDRLPTLRLAPEQAALPGREPRKYEPHFSDAQEVFDALTQIEGVVHTTGHFQMDFGPEYGQPGSMYITYCDDKCMFKTHIYNTDKLGYDIGYDERLGDSIAFVARFIK